MADIKPEVKFKGLEMLFVEAPFDKAKEALEKKGAKISPAQQIAQARIVAGKEHHVSQYGSWTAENLVYCPDGKIYITSSEYSPIFDHAPEATEAHRNGNEFYVPKKDLEAIVKAVKSGKAFALEETENYEIPISKFAENKLAKFLFKETAEPYATFLQSAGIKEVPVWLVGKDYQKEQKAPFARALWLHSLLLDIRSDLNGSVRNLVYYNWLRGVRKVAPLGAAKISAYEDIAQKYRINSPKELQNILEKYSQIKDLIK